jgi:hypothetical protein
VVTLAELLDVRERGGGPCLARLARHRQQRIGDLAQRRDDKDRAAAIAYVRAPRNLDQATDSVGICDRRAAEFLNNHGW